MRKKLANLPTHTLRTQAFFPEHSSDVNVWWIKLLLLKLHSAVAFEENTWAWDTFSWMLSEITKIKSIQLYFSMFRQRTTSYLWKKVSSIRLLFVSSVPATIVPNDPDRNFVARVKWLISLDLIEKKHCCFTCKAKWISRLKLKVCSRFFS